MLDQLQRLSADGSRLTVYDVNLAMDTVDRALGQAGTMTNIAALRATVGALSNLIDADAQVLKEADRASKSASRLVTNTPCIDRLQEFLVVWWAAGQSRRQH